MNLLLPEAQPVYDRMEYLLSAEDFLQQEIDKLQKKTEQQKEKKGRKIPGSRQRGKELLIP